MIYKTKRIEEEYYKLPDIGKLILDYTDNFSRNNFNKEIVVTHIFRKQKEQDSIYKGMSMRGRKYSIHPWYSDHQFWQAADIRSRIYNEDEILKIKDYINTNFRYNNKGIAKLVTYHEINHHGLHFHIRWCKETYALDFFNPYI